MDYVYKIAGIEGRRSSNKSLKKYFRMICHDFDADYYLTQDIYHDDNINFDYQYVIKVKNWHNVWCFSLYLVPVEEALSNSYLTQNTGGEPYNLITDNNAILITREKYSGMYDDTKLLKMVLLNFADVLPKINLQYDSIVRQYLPGTNINGVSLINYWLGKGPNPRVEE